MLKKEHSYRLYNTLTYIKGGGVHISTPTLMPVCGGEFDKHFRFVIMLPTRISAYFLFSFNLLADYKNIKKYGRRI